MVICLFVSLAHATRKKSQSTSLSTVLTSRSFANSSTLLLIESCKQQLQNTMEDICFRFRGKKSTLYCLPSHEYCPSVNNAARGKLSHSLCNANSMQVFQILRKEQSMAFFLVVVAINNVKTIVKKICRTFMGACNKLTT
jgi:hypothetical protein